MVDSVAERMKRDGSALAVLLGAGDVIARPSIVRDKVLAGISQADASGKIAWVLQDPEGARAGKRSAVFDGVLDGKGWKFQLYNYTSTRVTLEVKVEDERVCVGGEDILDRLYLRLQEKHGVKTLVRSFIAPHIQEEMIRDGLVLERLLSTFNRM